MFAKTLMADNEQIQHDLSNQFSPQVLAIQNMDVVSLLGVDYSKFKDEDIIEFHEKRDITGVVLKKRYEIGDKLGEGCFGQVHTAYDIHFRDRPLIIKLQQNIRQFEREVKFMALYKKKSDDEFEANKEKQTL